MREMDRCERSRGEARLRSYLEIVVVDVGGLEDLLVVLRLVEAHDG
jgi:hypothetical protein